jgi:uncharacterized protein (DUF1697 family)
MATVKAVVERLGYDDVWTLANSGNVVFDAAGSRAAIEREVGNALEAELGFEVTTFVRSVKELRATMALRPFVVKPGDTYFVTFLAQPATAKQRAALEAMSDDFDTLVVRGRDVHWLMHGRSIDTHITSKRWESVIGHHTSTSRNTTMLEKLLAKIDARESASLARAQPRVAE